MDWRTSLGLKRVVVRLDEERGRRSLLHLRARYLPLPRPRSLVIVVDGLDTITLVPLHGLINRALVENMKSLKLNLDISDMRPTRITMATTRDTGDTIRPRPPLSILPRLPRRINSNNHRLSSPPSLRSTRRRGISTKIMMTVQVQQMPSWISRVSPVVVGQDPIVLVN